ncbi:uncharacterized protein LOC120530588 [Polypterus senegalus]|uniref:uncharacterized protein LOC120530588 n=1 Tax=Polypterus senegalus TaxID=55291 RepID=UPI0019652DAD|nr:uncharacterized protein LOC120530588 [Polypterus senegalus]XP_039610948.1 uncharacterized protein LOC120530588 [Polypterus senegalus]
MIYLLLLGLAIILPKSTVLSESSYSMKEAYSQSLALSRKMHQDVRILLLKYKQQQMGTQSFEDFSFLMASLPVINMNFSYWLNMEEGKRIQLIIKDLKVFQSHIEAKCLYEEQHLHQSQLVQDLQLIKCDISDLVFQMHLQLKSLNVPVPVVSEPLVPKSLLNPQLEWNSKLQGYIILRDLEQYLGKVVRDFTFLKSKY